MLSRIGGPLLATTALIALACCSSALADAPSDTVWLCKPGVAPDPCHEGLETTVYDSPLATHVENPPLAAHPKVDCFYVYPTVSGQPGPNADLSIDPELTSIAEYQAGRFSQQCRVFAPVYPQLTLSTIGNTELSEGQVVAAAKVAYRGVRDAWRDYLAHYNHGRGVVLIGHSQGTGMLRALIRKQIDPKKRVRRLLVSAMLLGGNVTVKRGSDVGGDFKQIRACHSPNQTRCVIAYSTFNETPPADALFGRPSNRFSQAFGLPGGPNLQVLCTNPAALDGGVGSLQTISRTEPFPGTLGVGLLILYGGALPLAPTPWIQPPGHYDAQCVDSNGANVLMVSDQDGAVHLHPSPDSTWGLHLADVNIALGNLVDLVATQAKAYLKKGK
jgi:pimeloyl-ACP methyl ester carboxylesterase